MNIRLATLNDARTLFDWRNDALTCDMSRNRDPVKWADHIAWLTKRLTRPGLYIAEIDGVQVGTFRVDGDEISYTVAPDHRRKGVATMMLQEAYLLFGPLRAEIYSRNVASISAAKAAGMIIVGLDEEVAQYG